ncbi:hypothetical protein WA026_000025 [Henosepilachna vigintioctopunctata]|uniref:Major facilitator superfamily (MFS) profile domain-containing protein n=1 Tax=Henosepilachna vigintioctopunctata TaxID=420089 RepID=A0AAW1UX53_9CUCU
MDVLHNASSEKNSGNIGLWIRLSHFFGNKYIYFVVFVVNILNLISGLSFAWSSPVLVELNRVQNNPLGYTITPNESSLVGSLFYIGAAIGPLLLLKCSDKLGRRTFIIVLSTFLPLSYGVLAVAKTIQLFYVCRMVTGLIIGITCCITPVYITEILPANIRGSIMSLSNTSIQTGILLTYIIGPFVSIMVFNLIITGLSVVFLVSFALTCPETPYYIMKTKGKEEAKDLLALFRSENIDEELKDIEESVKTQMKNETGNYKIIGFLKPFMMATTLLVIQQFTGINILIGYSQLIFLETGIKFSSAKCSIIVGCLQVASAFIAPVFSEKFPRKSMLCFSLFGLSICNFVLSLYFYLFKGTGYVNWLPLAALVLFVIFDNCGNGPLPWVLLGEIYPMHFRPVGPALSTSVYCLVQFLLMLEFNKINLKYTFFVFGCCSIFGIIFVRFFITETRGKTLRQIGDELEEAVPLKKKQNVR